MTPAGQLGEIRRMLGEMDDDITGCARCSEHGHHVLVAALYAVADLTARGPHAGLGGVAGWEVRATIAGALDLRAEHHITQDEDQS